MMKVKTTGTVLILLAVALVGGWFLQTPSEDGGDTVSVVLMVTTQVQDAQVTYWVDGVPFGPEQVNERQWDRTVHLARGERVVLRAVHNGWQLLQATIVHAGMTNHLDQDYRYDPGLVEVRATA